MINVNKVINAEVISVFPDKVKVAVDNLKDFQQAGESLKVGSYLRISDSEDAVLIAIIENFSIEIINDKDGNPQRKYILEALPLGMIKDGKFERGGDTIAIPPKTVEPAKASEIEKVYSQSLKERDKFTFSKLSTNKEIDVPVNGDKFFNKHIAIVGSTGSGKSHTVAKILQQAISSKEPNYEGLNNSHIIIFDIHSEYKSAFPEANYIDINNLVLPYWLLNGDEIEDILLDTGERDNYNQSSVFRNLVTENKKKYNPKVENITYDSPLKYDINEILNAVCNLKNETKNAKASDRYMIIDDSYELLDKGTTNESSGISLSDSEKTLKYFTEQFKFHTTKLKSIIKGDYADGTLNKFSIRIDRKINDKRLKFLFGEEAKNIKFEDFIKRILGYSKKKSNVTVIDLSGIPFEVLTITVSLISRVIFEYGYIYKKLRCNIKPDEKTNNDVPFLLVYEEAHKYAPTSDLVKYRSSKQSIERIAKEGRKYGVSLLLASQRPSEISETIFSQCNNFITMRLTNPNDQNYVKKLLPDTLGHLIDKLSTLKAGEALLLGESVILPSIVQIDRCNPEPSSNDIPYYQLWKEEWKDIKFDELTKEWIK